MLRFLVFVLLGALFLPNSAYADAPRLAIVVVGDPAAPTVAAAERLEGVLLASPEATLPADPAMRSALRGSPAPATDDGLEPVRALRRSLGWSDEADREALATLGGRLELVAIVLVRGGTIPTARVYDIGAARTFTGEAPLDEASTETSARFVLARLRAAEQRRREAPTPDEAARASVEPAAADADARAADAATSRTEAPAGDDAPRRRSWIGRNWPFFVAGALVVGTTTFFVLQRDDRSNGTPVIHIRPGGTP